jgi:hypothetical protein
MATTVWGAQGTTFSVDESGVNANGTFTVFNNITSLANIGGGEVGERDTTVLASTVKTNAPTIPDNQEATVEFYPDPTDAVHRFVRDLKDTPVGFCNWKTVLSTGNANSSCTFSAWVKTFDGYNFDDVDADVTATLTLRKTGAVTWVNS